MERGGHRRGWRKGAGPGEGAARRRQPRHQQTDGQGGDTPTRPVRGQAL